MVGYATTSSTTATWTEWNRIYIPTVGATTLSTTSTTATTTAVWRTWTGGATGNVEAVTVSSGTGDNVILSSTSNTATAGIWGHWNEVHVQAARNDAVIRMREPSPEELQARLREEQERRQAAELRYAEERRAREKAEALLEEHLNQQQVQSLREKNYFELEVHSKDGSQKKYRINRGYAGNVQLLDASGKPVQRYCIHPSIKVPDADAMLVQKLLLESDEEMFLRTANMTRLW